MYGECIGQAIEPYFNKESISEDQLSFVDRFKDNLNGAPIESMGQDIQEDKILVLRDPTKLAQLESLEVPKEQLETRVIAITLSDNCCLREQPSARKITLAVAVVCV